MYRHAKHLFFDLDDTLTLSRSAIDGDMKELLSSLGKDLVVISGAQSSQIRTQIGDVSTIVMGQNGNEAIDVSGDILWREPISEEDEQVIRKHIDALKSFLAIRPRREDDLVEHRGAQISYSIIGHNEDVTIKKSFDPDRSKRRSLLMAVPFTSRTIEVKLGGTTCFDYFLKGRHKGFNISKLIAHKGWNANDCLYFGDALVPGGNDETVVGVIETISVDNHRHTYKILKEHLAG